MALASIGLGSNVGDAAANVERALEAIGRLGSVRARSHLYRTRAWGVRSQADFINAAALLETALEPHALLAALKGLEGELGRVATYRWGPRAIDLDILTYGDAVVREADLVIPHERLFERAFALAPLAEIDPAFRAAYERLPAEARAEVERIASGAPRSATVVDWEQTLERVRSAAEFAASAGLVKFRVDEGDLSIEVRLSPRPVDPAAAPAPPAATSQAPAAAPASNGVSHNERPPDVVRAEFVGIVHLSRPAVSEGDQLPTSRELAYVESLGVRNPVRSNGPGRVSAIYVSEGQAVEYGQPLFAIEPSA